jgi:hypothetical protein
MQSKVADLEYQWPRNLIEFGQYSEKFNYFYCATPKVACTSIMLTLQRLEIGDMTFSHGNDGSIHERHLSPLKSPEVEDIERSKFKFCFVRNPFDRLLSCYLDKVYNEASLERRFQIALGKTGPVSFREFIDVICDEPDDAMEPHYAPQAQVTCQDVVRYDYAGRFEALEKDLATACELMGVNITPYMARIDAHKTGEKPYGWLEPDLVKKIKSKFAIDFDTFKYATTVPVA